MNESSRINEHMRILRSNLEENLRLLEHRIIEFDLNPKIANVQTLKSYFEAQVALEKNRLSIADLTDQDRLLVLDRLEDWYTSRNYSFPNQQWLDTQRKKLRG